MYRTIHRLAPIFSADVSRSLRCQTPPIVAGLLVYCGKRGLGAVNGHGRYNGIDMLYDIYLRDGAKSVESWGINRETVSLTWFTACSASHISNFCVVFFLSCARTPRTRVGENKSRPRLRDIEHT